MTTGRDDGFLRRWSRLKEEARSEAPKQDTRDAAGPDAALPADRPSAAATAPSVEPPPLPPVDSLTMESDFRAFFHPKVEEGLRRAALKKLFSDPHFNAMDGLDVYIDDYSVSEPLTDAALSQLEQAKKIFGWAREDAEERERRAAERVQVAEGQPARVASAENALLQMPADRVDNAASSPPAESPRKPE